MTTAIRCDCGAFKAELLGVPKNTPGRLACYCGDCQNFLKKIGREELLDDFGGTEIVPVYPAEFVIVAGKELLKCNRLTKKGLERWTVTCCGAPIANTQRKMPWVGVLHNTFTVEDPQVLERLLGPIRSRINGNSATGTPNVKIAKTLDFRAVRTVLPFIFKGKIFRKSRPHAFYENGRPVSKPVVL